MSTATVPLAQDLRPDAREIGLAVINRVVPAYERYLHTCDDACLLHESERWEAMPHSPLSTAMTALIDGERQWRRRGGHRG